MMPGELRCGRAGNFVPGAAPSAGEAEPQAAGTAAGTAAAAMAPSRLRGSECPLLPVFGSDISGELAAYRTRAGVGEMAVAGRPGGVPVLDAEPDRSGVTIEQESGGNSH